MSIAGNYGQVDTAVMIQSIRLMFRHNYGHYQISAPSAKERDGVNPWIPQAETAKEGFVPWVTHTGYNSWVPPGAADAFAPTEAGDDGRPLGHTKQMDSTPGPPTELSQPLSLSSGKQGSSNTKYMSWNVTSWVRGGGSGSITNCKEVLLVCIRKPHPPQCHPIPTYTVYFVKDALFCQTLQLYDRGKCLVCKGLS